MQWEAFAREGRLAGNVYTSKEASSSLAPSPFRIKKRISGAIGAVACADTLDADLGSAEAGAVSAPLVIPTVPRQIKSQSFFIVIDVMIPSVCKLYTGATS